MSSNLKVNNILPSTGTTVAVSGIASVTSSVSIASSCTATTFYGSGANLTGISGVSVANQADNRLITATGTSDALNSEANFTYNGGNNLTLNSTAHDGGFNLLAANNNQETRFRIQGKASDGTGHSFYLNAKRSANRLDIAGGAGANLTVMGSTKNVGVDNTGPESPLHIGSNNQITTAKATVCVAPASGNASMTLRGGSPTIYFDGTSNGNAKFLTDGTDLTISNGTLDSAGNERLRFRADGGICFNGDTAAANALDDYEEGEYTANLRVTSGSATFTTQGGSGNKLYYTKIGDICYVNGGFSASSVSGAGGDIKFNLPFASKNSSAGVAKGIVGAIWNYYGSNNPVGNYGWYPLHAEGLNANVSNNVTLYIIGYNGTNSNWGPIGGLIGNNSQVHFSFTYRTN